MDFIPNEITRHGTVKIRIEAVGGDLDRVACRYPLSFMDEMALQLTPAIEAATGTYGIADSTVELIMAFSTATFMEHISGNVTYRRLLLIDSVSAPRDFWIKWTRLEAIEGEYNSDNILFELGEDVDQKIRQAEYKYLLQSGGEKYHNSMGRKKVTEWREVIRRAAKRGEIGRIESDTELMPETLEIEQLIADVLGKRLDTRPEPIKDEIPFIHSDESEFNLALEKMRMVVEADEEMQNAECRMQNDEEVQNAECRVQSDEEVQNAECRVQSEPSPSQQAVPPLPEGETNGRVQSDEEVQNAECRVQSEPSQSQQAVPPLPEGEANGGVQSEEEVQDSVDEIEEIDLFDLELEDEHEELPANIPEEELILDDSEEDEEMQNAPSPSQQTVPPLPEGEANGGVQNEEAKDFTEEEFEFELIEEEAELMQNTPSPSQQAVPPLPEGEANGKMQNEVEIEIEDETEFALEIEAEDEIESEDEPEDEIEEEAELMQNAECKMQNEVEIEIEDETEFALEIKAEAEIEDEIEAEPENEVEAEVEPETEVEEAPVAEPISIADRVADIRAELEIKIRLEYETRAREKAEAELIELRRSYEKLRIESEEAITALVRENERLRLDYELLTSQTESERLARNAEEARLRLEEQQLRAQIETQLRAEAAERERLAEAARMAMDEQRRLEAENARIARQKEEEERAEAERRRLEEHEKELEAIRIAEVERIRREDEEARAKARAAMPEMGDGRYSYTSKTVRLIFRQNVDPNITTRIHEIIKATVDYYGKEGVYLRIKASVPDTQTVVLEFADIPLEEMALLGNIIKILGNSGLGIAKAIIE